MAMYRRWASTNDSDDDAGERSLLPPQQAALTSIVYHAACGRVVCVMSRVALPSSVGRFNKEKYSIQFDSMTEIIRVDRPTVPFAAAKRLNCNRAHICCKCKGVIWQ